jgi:hypothetical protein
VLAHADAPEVFGDYLAYELPGALEAQTKRLLHGDPKEPEALQLPRALQRTDVDGPQAPVAHKLCYRLLCLLVVPSNEHIERLACDLGLQLVYRRRWC